MESPNLANVIFYIASTAAQVAASMLAIAAAVAIFEFGRRIKKLDISKEKIDFHLDQLMVPPPPEHKTFAWWLITSEELHLTILRVQSFFEKNPLRLLGPTVDSYRTPHPDYPPDLRIFYNEILGTRTLIKLISLSTLSGIFLITLSILSLAAPGIDGWQTYYTETST